MTPPQQLSPPRVEHNAALAKKFGLGPVYPPVTKQLEVLPFNRLSIKPFAYNPSIMRWGNRILMTYRWHPESNWKTRLCLCELDEKWKVISNKDIDFGSRHSEEDPHLFVHKDGLWISWVESVDFGHCVVKYGELKEGKAWVVPTQFQPKYGRNDGNGMEKNWVFHENNGKINFFYQFYPYAQVVSVIGDECSEFAKISLPHWPWGTRKGGCICGDFYFFHSTLNNEFNPNAVNNSTRRYYIGAQKIGDLCSRPILYGSELSDLTQTEMSSCKHYKANVVFCSGAITLPDGSFAISVGINDSQCALLRVQEHDLHL